MARLYAAAWITWIVAFLAIELTAIASGHSRYTLSDYVWRLEQIDAGWTFLRYFVAAFCVWLALHMIFGWFR